MNPAPSVDTGEQRSRLLPKPASIEHLLLTARKEEVRNLHRALYKKGRTIAGLRRKIARLEASVA